MLSDEQIQILKISKERNRKEYIGISNLYEKIANGQPVCYTKLNPLQHFLFKRVLHGLKMYDKEEVSKMHWDKKRRITKVWKRAQHVINRWKQWICYKDSNQIFGIFANSKLGKAFCDAPFYYLHDYRNKFTLKELHITYEDLIIKFIDEGLLPKNFLNIKQPSESKKETLQWL